MIRRRISSAFTSLKRGRLIFLFFFCVILPTIPLAYLAFRTLSGETETISSEINEQLERVGEALSRLASEPVLGCAGDLVKEAGTISASGGPVSATVDLKKQCPYILSFFILDSRLTLLFPFGKVGVTADEFLGKPRASAAKRDFVDRMRKGAVKEFAGTDPGGAMKEYLRALDGAASEPDRIVAMNAAARCGFSLGRYTDSISYYSAIISSEGGKVFYSDISMKPLAMFRAAAAEEKEGLAERAAERYLELMRGLADGNLAGSVYEASFYVDQITQRESGLLSILDIGEDYGSKLGQARERWKQTMKAALLMDSLLDVYRRDFHRMIDEHYDSNEEFHTKFRMVEGRETLLVYGVFTAPMPDSPLLLAAVLDTDALKEEIRILFRKALASEPDINMAVVGPAGEMIVSAGDFSDSSRHTLQSSLGPVFPLWRIRLAYRKGGLLFEVAMGKRRTRLSYITMLVAIILLGIYITYSSVKKDSELARLKSDFVSRVSHELRTPLATIRAMGEMLEMGAVSSREKEREYFSAIASESERLTRLINNVLDFSRIGAGQRTYVFKKSDVKKTVSDTVRAFGEYMKSEGFEVIYKEVGEIPTASIDQDAVSQALINLMDNAMKFSRDEREIWVKIEHTEPEIAISVRDKGIGILPADLERIFHSFYRPEESREHAGRGAGIGLAIVKHIAEAHRGRVEVESTHGEGSMFRIVLPVGE